MTKWHPGVTGAACVHRTHLGGLGGDSSPLPPTYMQAASTQPPLLRFLHFSTTQGYQLLRTLPGTDPMRPAPSHPAAAVVSPDGHALVISAPSRRRVPRPPGSSGAGRSAARQSAEAVAGSGSSDTLGAPGQRKGCAAGVRGPPAERDSSAGCSCLLVFDMEELEPRLCIETRESGFSRWV
jgi:hypothetical protein